MGEGDWKVAAYIDSIASGKAYNGLLRILSGQAGGTTGSVSYTHLTLPTICSV